MNNTQTLATIAAILIAATLVVGGTLAATTSASAYTKKGSHNNGGDKIRGNGNTDTDTIQKCKQFASGFDPTFGDQNCDILSNSTISQAAVTPVNPPIPGACPEGTTFDVALDETLANEVNLGIGTILCLSKLGAQDAFALVDSGITVGVVVAQPNTDGTCSPPFVHATVASGNPPNPITTAVCVKLG